MADMGLPMMKTDQHYTYGDYAAWPDDERWELIDGIAYNMSPVPSLKHQRVLRKLATRIDQFLTGRSCELFIAPFDVTFPDFAGQDLNAVQTVVQPDLSVICDPGKLTDRGCTGAPDLIVEILSPYTSKKDLNEKFRLYERQGVREYWIVDHESRYIRVFVLGEEGKYDGETLVLYDGSPHSQNPVKSTVLEGFSITLQELFD